MRRRLAAFTGRGYDKGRSPVWQIAWLAASGAVVTRWWCPVGVRVAILRAFGATIGENVLIRHRVRIHWPWKLTVGDDSWIGEDTWILNLEPVTIGSDVCVSQGGTPVHRKPPQGLAVVRVRQRADRRAGRRVDRGARDRAPRRLRRRGQRHRSDGTRHPRRRTRLGRSGPACSDARRGGRLNASALGGDTDHTDGGIRRPRAGRTQPGESPAGTRARRRRRGGHARIRFDAHRDERCSGASLPRADSASSHGVRRPHRARSGPMGRSSGRHVRRRPCAPRTRSGHPCRSRDGRCEWAFRSSCRRTA